MELRFGAVELRFGAVRLRFGVVRLRFGFVKRLLMVALRQSIWHRLH